MAGSPWFDGPEQHAAHLRAALGNRTESAHYFRQDTVDHVQMEWTTTGLPGHLPNIVIRALLVSLPPFQLTFHRTTMTGTLYIVSTPIGNLEDITLRALRVLREADCIACEDTRQTRKLLDHFGISKPTLSYHDHNEAARTAELIERLNEGENIALVSDAGTPLISDPGYRLVAAAIAGGIAVVPIPGPSAVMAALARRGPAHRCVPLLRIPAAEIFAAAEDFWRN